MDAVPDNGDCGFETAALLLKKHIPLYQDPGNSPSADFIRRTLADAVMEDCFGKDMDGDEGKENVSSMVQCRSLQCMEASALVEQNRFHNAVKCMHKEILKNAQSGMPYFMQTEDWSLLSAKLGVNFVLHDLPGSVRPQPTSNAAENVRLNVQWSSSKSVNEWGHWKPSASFKRLLSGASKITGQIDLSTPSPVKRVKSALDDSQASDDELHDPEGGAMDDAEFTDVCLFLALQSMGFPVGAPHSGPFRVSQGNVVLAKFGVALHEVSSMCVSEGGCYLVHDASDIKAHFFHLELSGCDATKYDKDHNGVTIVDHLYPSELLAMLADSTKTFYKLGLSTGKPEIIRDLLAGANRTRRGSGKSCHTTKPAEQLRTCETHLENCVCGGSLSKDHIIDAQVYGTSGPFKVKVQTWRCNDRDCRAVHGPNFYVENGEKINTAEISDLSDILFINNKKGFTATCECLSSLFAYFHCIANLF